MRINNGGTATISGGNYATVLVQFPASEPFGQSGRQLLAGGAVIDYWNGTRDADSDGLPDWWESLYFGCATNAAPETVSANGRSHLENYQLGFDPGDPEIRMPFFS